MFKFWVFRSEEQAMRTMADGEAGSMLATSSLGELLVADRTTAGLDVDDLSRTTGFPVERIEAVESGRHDLTDGELATLLDRYASLASTRRPFRALVEIDLDTGSLKLRPTRRARSLPAADRNLLHYLSMVHRHHGLRPGTEIPLKAVDLSLLRSSLALRRGEVSSRLERMSEAIGPRLSRNRSILAVAAATGLVVAAGAIVLIPSGRSGPESGRSTGAVTPTIDIGTPLVVERPPFEIPSIDQPVSGGPEVIPELIPEVDSRIDGAVDRAVDPGLDLGPGVAPAPAPLPQIGTPLVVERPAAALVPPSPPVDQARPRGPPIEDLMISS